MGWVVCCSQLPWRAVGALPSPDLHQYVAFREIVSYVLTERAREIESLRLRPRIGHAAHGGLAGKQWAAEGTQTMSGVVSTTMVGQRNPLLHRPAAPTRSKISVRESGEVIKTRPLHSGGILRATILHKSLLERVATPRCNLPPQ